jgi:hypothetical protein
MKAWIGAAVLAVTLMPGNVAAINAATAASMQAGQQPKASKTTDHGARRDHRHQRRYAFSPIDQPSYYGRPTYYRPYPYDVPVPFFLGFGFGPLW